MRTLRKVKELKTWAIEYVTILILGKMNTVAYKIIITVTKTKTQDPSWKSEASSQISKQLSGTIKNKQIKGIQSAL